MLVLTQLAVGGFLFEPFSGGLTGVFTMPTPHLIAPPVARPDRARGEPRAPGPAALRLPRA